MRSFSRRQFLGTTAALPLAMWVSRHALAQSATLVRYDIASPEGADMMVTYANAMRAMLARGQKDPLSWMWQWYTHFVDGTTTKSAEINRIFGKKQSTLKSLATSMWNTCQSHAGQNYNHFMPWHRMFVYYFEDIVRQVSGRADFTLPYWDYTSSDPAKRGVVPEQFRLPDDPVFGVLYRSNRTSLANTGQPIQKNQAGDPMDITTAMAAPTYSNDGTAMGFCRGIDAGVHGRVHVLVGTSSNMGAVPYAARDPLFWVHHSNVDRMWASWNRNGGANPYDATWASTQFVFADRAGQRVTARLRDFFDTSPFGYTYDQFIPSATGTTAFAMLATGRASERVASSTTPAELGTGHTVVTLRKLAAASQSTSVLGLAPASSPQRSYLVLKELNTWKQPEVLYHVYLTPRRGAALNRNTYVGAIHFFDAEFHDHGASPLDTALGENFFSFDVTELLRRYERSGAVVREALEVTFVPGGRARGDAGAMVASIDLVRQ